jgi:hypothetical protein
LRISIPISFDAAGRSPEIARGEVPPRRRGRLKRERSVGECGEESEGRMKEGKESEETHCIEIGELLIEVSGERRRRRSDERREGGNGDDFHRIIVRIYEE